MRRRVWMLLLFLANATVVLAHEAHEDPTNAATALVYEAHEDSSGDRERASGEHGSGEHGSGEHGSGEHGSGEHGSGGHGSGQHDKNNDSDNSRLLLMVLGGSMLALGGVGVAVVAVNGVLATTNAAAVPAAFAVASFGAAARGGTLPMLPVLLPGSDRA